jgi:carbonic anhydrase/acetyltransferase-like protein (isoleucine patch superfamily)
MVSALIVPVGDHVPEIDPTALVVPGATVAGNVRLGARCSVWFSAVVRGDLERIEIGDETNLQDGVVVHSDPGLPAVIGRAVTVGHAAVVHGATVGDGALIGIGARVLNGATIGAGALIGAGTVVPEGADVPAGMLVVGVPGKVRRPVTEAEAERIRRGHANYLALTETYRQTFPAS